MYEIYLFYTVAMFLLTVDFLLAYSLVENREVFHAGFATCRHGGFSSGRCVLSCTVAVRASIVKRFVLTPELLKCHTDKLSFHNCLSRS